MKWNLVVLSLHFFIISFITSCSFHNQLSPVELKTEYRSNPMGIDVLSPRFSWIMNDSARGSGQSAYQIIISDNLKNLDKNEGNIWDSQKINDSKSHLIEYAGNKLESSKRYFWKVRIWDLDGNPTSYSSPAWFETGFLKKEDWQAKWISGQIAHKLPVKDDIGSWIQPLKNISTNTIWFRTHFELPSNKTIKDAALRLTSMGGFRIYLNNKYMSSGNDYKHFFYNNVTLYLNEGKNTLAVQVKPNADNPPSIIFHIHVVFDDNTTLTIASNENTFWSTEEGKEIEVNSLDDASWKKTRTVASFGDHYWGKPTQIMDPPIPIAMRHEFEIKEKVKSARIYATGLGSYVLFLNGQRIGKDILTPGWTHYPKKVQYQTYDITSILNNNKNALGVWLGNVWWSSGLGWNGGSFYSNGPLRFLAQLEITYTDGSKEIISTDKTWKFSDAPITYSTLYDGEFYDARIEQDGWSEPGFIDDSWQQVSLLNNYEPELLAQQAAPIRITQELKPIAVNTPYKGVHVFDMGQNMVGRARLKIHGQKGQKIILKYAELLHDDGTVAQENLRSAKATDVYIAKGETIEEWSPDFTYHGFRYVQVEGLTEKPQADMLTGEVFHNDEPLSGKFTSSNMLLNQIWENITWGQRGNMMSVPTDCPQRDERLGWMGDAQIFAATANYAMYMPEFWNKWTRDIIDCQEPQGWVYDVNPAIVVSGPSKPAWGDAVTLVPWFNYLFFADERILKESYEGMKKWVDYMSSKSENYIYEWGDNDWGGYGDWVAVEPSPTKPIGGIYYYYSSKILGKTAAILGESEDSKKYLQQAENIAKAFHAQYYDASTGNYEGATQTANLLPLALGITPKKDIDRVTQSLVDNVKSHNHHLTTGFLGTKYLLPFLSDAGYHNIAYKVATQTTYPSWGYMIEKGATTMWELWNSDTELPEGMNSRNHFAYGSVGEWYFSHLAGIQPIEKYPGFKTLRISPQPVPELEQAEASFLTPYGTVKSHWEQTPERFVLKVTIPWNTEGLVAIPNKENKQIMERRVIVYDSMKGTDTKAISFIRSANDTVYFRVGAGNYQFIVE